MARNIAAFSLLLGLSFQLFVMSRGEREVLIRDRLVLVLCDQIHEYLTSGNMPAPVKKMPEKYKKIKPGVSGSMDGYKVVSPGSKKKRHTEDYYKNHPILDFIYE